jgi:hypothetical protein
MAKSSRALAFVCWAFASLFAWGLGLGGTRLMTSDDRQVNLFRSPGLHAQTPGSRRRARRRQQPLFSCHSFVYQQTSGDRLLFFSCHALINKAVTLFILFVTVLWIGCVN